MSTPATSASKSNAEELSDNPIQSGDLANTVIRFAGNSQDGIQTIGGFLAKLAGRSSRDVMTYMTIPSTISGGPSIFQVHLASGEVLSSGDEADFLFAFYQHSYEEHIDSLRDGGICIYDSVHVNPDKQDKRVRNIGIPITSITVEALGGTTKDRGKNMLTLGLVTQLFQLDRSKLVSLIEGQFKRKGDDVFRNAMLAFEAGYAYQVGDLFGESFNLKAGASGNKDQITTDGNTALALGLIAGGVRFGAAYPITPWTTIMEHLRMELPKHGGLFVQTEDELAAVTMALGFSYAGHLAVTGSSGPGISLKMEALGYGSMAELPLVVVNVQRGGPSTGLPTNVEQSDLMQAIYGSHGDSPRVVIAPLNVEDCFYTAIEACQLAKKCSAPVMILTDQALATRIEAFPEPDLNKLVIEPELSLEMRPEGFEPYPLDDLTRHAPPGSKLEGGKYPVVTGLEHDAWGHPSADPEMHQLMVERRREKIRILADDFPPPEVFGDESGDVLLVGWGSTWGPIREATIRARDKDLSYSSLSIRHLNPLPNGLKEIFHRFKHVVVIEMNDSGLYGYGQLATLLRARYTDPKILSVTKTDGLTYKVKEILSRVDAMVS